LSLSAGTALASAPGKLAVAIDGPASASLTLTGPGGSRVIADGPTGLCGLAPGDWQVQVTAAGFASARASVTVPPDATAALHLKLQPIGSVVVEGDSSGTLYDASGKVVKRHRLAPGNYLYKAGEASWIVPVRPGVLTRLDTRQPGIVVGGKRLALPPGLTVQTWLEPGGKRLRAHRLREERWYDKGPLTRLDELQWKVRAFVVHRGYWKDLKQVWRRMHKPRKRSGRQFLVSPDGVVHQVLDLYDHTFAGGPTIDPTVVSIEMGTRWGTEPTDVQVKAAGLLLEALSALFPRVRTPFPADPETKVPSVRAVRGLLTARQAGYHGDGRFAVDWAGLSKAARGVPMKLPAPTTTLPSGVTTGLAVLADVTGAALTARRGETKSTATTPWVDCSGGAAFDVTVSHPARAAASTRTTSGVTRVKLPKLGALNITGPAGTAVILDGPGGFRKRVTLPWSTDVVRAGTYRASVAQDGRPPYRWAVRVVSGEASVLTLPDLSVKGLPHILIAGHRYPLPKDIRVVNHKARKGMSFYRERRRRGRGYYTERRLPDGQDATSLAEVSQLVRSVVLHADVTKDTAAMFRVLVSRGLSTHFGIDWDGTLYQFLDPRETAFAAAEVNPFSVQIDLNNRLPNLVESPKATYVPRFHPGARKMRTAEFARPMSPRMMINRRDVKSFGYNAHQYRALYALLTVLAGVIDGIEPAIPRDTNGQLPMKHANWIEDFSGIIAHFHLSPRRWDPGPGFDWEALDLALSGRLGSAKVAGTAAPPTPSPASAR